MQYLSFRLLFPVLLFFSCSKKITTGGDTVAIPPKNPLLDFKILNTPKENLDFGAEWATGIGPTRKSLPDSDLAETRSLSNYDINQNSEFAANLKVGILNLLGLGSDFNSSKNYNLTIDSATVVRVSTLDNLNYYSEGIFLWEGIKVKLFSITSSKHKRDSVLLSIKKVTNLSEISAKQTFFDSTKISLKASNLFVAYRLIKFGEVKSEDVKDVTFFTTDLRHKNPTANDYKAVSGITSFNVGNAYSAHIYKRRDFISKYYVDSAQMQSDQSKSCLWPDFTWSPRYDWVVVFQFNNHIVNGKPREVYYKMGVSDNLTEDCRFTLQTKIADNKLVREFLEFKNINVNILSYDLPYFSVLPVETTYIHHKSVMEMINYEDNTTPGW